MERQLNLGYKAALRSLTLLSGAFLYAGCGTSHSSTASKITVSFPQAAVQAAAGTGSTYDFTKACFAINVTAGDITSTSKASCDVPRGIFEGFVAPGGTLSLTVPKGSGRKLEIFSYLRSSATANCLPQTDFGKLAPNKITRVGLVPSFDTQTDTVSLDVTLVAPASTDNLVTQYFMPSSCSVADVQAPISSAKLTNAHVHTTGGNLVIDASVSGQTNGVHLQGGALQIQLSRSTQ